MSTEDDETSWVFESLVGYLRGPAWNIPIITFIEQKSIVFEPGPDNEEYKKIHNEYKNLVDFMLGSHMEDMGITPEQFEKVCGKANRGIAAKFHQGLFEQVWAADDYEIFKRMMTQKNIDLQLQALEIMAQRYGLVPDAFQGEPQGAADEDIQEEKSDNDNAKEDEEALMAHVIKKSLEDMAAAKESESMEEKLIEEAIQATLVEKQRLEVEKSKEKELLDKALKLSLKEPAAADTPEDPEPKVLAGQLTEHRPSIVEEDLATRHQPVSSEEVNQRREYLRSQRDKLVALKRAEREKQLSSTLEQDTVQRPRSSRAARAALQGDVALEAPNDDSGNLAFRKSLAARLKAEVIDS
ncbi:cilia- and flagella-associated protein 36 isoform X1 [Ixodes scapularis]|uniref:cilia- and flagella-associated protein 36 isoform X1 n=1 Tax=Ixodes scapularis TaxID=6945 RepID=UPI0011617244|nr:cilia- and flagella-associated protein 36 isoform X1 [Ixodes scapularis]XP_042144400.1 cilia- and flagella-associated protein 36 isoform X1 [Ixodes scapularis]